MYVCVFVYVDMYTYVCIDTFTHTYIHTDLQSVEQASRKVWRVHYSMFLFEGSEERPSAGPPSNFLLQAQNHMNVDLESEHRKLSRQNRDSSRPQKDLNTKLPLTSQKVRGAVPV